MTDSNIGPTEVSFEVRGVHEYATLRANTFREAMRGRDALRDRLDDAEAQVTTLEWQLSEATKAAEIYEQRHTRLLDDIEEWNATIAVGQAKAKQMEAVIEAARGVINCLDLKPDDHVWDHASGGACLNLLDEALAAYDASPDPLPAPFSQS